jgi:hypothetical protein
MGESMSERDATDDALCDTAHDASPGDDAVLAE